MHLYETHLPVADTKAAEKFYHEIVGCLSPIAIQHATSCSCGLT